MSSFASVLSVILLLSGSIATPTFAQASQTRQEDLAGILRPGMTVWVTESGGREERMRIVGVSGDALMTTTDRGNRTIQTTDLVRVRARQSDSLLNGAFIGAAAGVASGLFLCRLTEPWDVCRGNVGPWLRIGALGAGIGIAVDALSRGRRTIYEAPVGATMPLTPIAADNLSGLQVSIGF